MNEERSTVHCTNCSREFIATLDLSLNGNHVIRCPHCFHDHYRVVRDGRVTEDRWQSSAGPLIYASTSTTITANLSFSGTTITALSTSWLTRSDLNLT